MDVAGFIVGVVGVLLAVYFYVRTRRKVRLIFQVRSFDLVDQSVVTIPGLSIRFNDSPVRNLVAAKIWLFNAGNQIVTRADFAEKDPLVLVIDGPDAAILSGRVTESSKPSNDVSFTPASGAGIVPITFDYLAPGESCVLGLLHTASGPSDVRLRGTLKGGDIITFRRIPQWLERVHRITAPLMNITSIVVMATVAILVARDANLMKWQTPTLLDQPWFAWTLVSLVLVIAVVNFLYAVLDLRPEPTAAFARAFTRDDVV